MANDFQVPWVEMLKPNLEVIEEGRLELSQTPEDLHKNHNGDMHAGVIFSMLEMAGMGVVTLYMGDAVKDAFVVLKDIYIEYLARAQGKIRFVAELTDEQKALLTQAIADKSDIELEITSQGLDESGKAVCQAKMVGVIKAKKR